MAPGKKSDDSRHDSDKRRDSSDDHGAVDERVLIAGCLLNEWDALGKLVLLYTPAVDAGAVAALKTFSGRTCADRAELVEDFFLEVFTSPQAHLGGWDANVGPLGPWLKTVAFHRCSKMLASARFGWPKRTEGGASDAIDWVPDRPAAPPHASDILARLIAKLSATTRDIVQARLGQGPYPKPLSVAEIAAMKGMSTDQVYRKIYMIRRHRHLKRMLDDLTG